MLMYRNISKAFQNVGVIAHLISENKENNTTTKRTRHVYSTFDTNVNVHYSNYDVTQIDTRTERDVMYEIKNNNFIYCF